MKKWNLVIALLLLSLISFSVLIINNGFSEVSIRLCIRLSARISATFFSMAFMASSLHYFYKRRWTAWMFSNRKNLGISFALVHLIHLAFLGVLHMKFHPIFEVAATSSLIGGGLAYVFAVLMLLTSFNEFSRFLSSRQWTLLHTIGGYWIWFIFIKSYYKRVTTELEFLPLLLMFILVVMLRLGKLYAEYRKVNMN